ncbi:MAG: gliding motility-associated C-terminal domain-containing protein [Saprospiraceae bacterium]
MISTFRHFSMVLLLLLSYLTGGLAQRPFDCNGRIYRVLEEQGGTYFQEIHLDLAGQEAVFENLNFFNGLHINGIGYRPLDNLVYGVLLEEPYVLCRIDANYELERLADLPLPTSMIFVSGDISPDEKYLVLLGFTPDSKDNLLALVDLTSPTYPTTILPLAKKSADEAVHCADIAFHPTLDLLYGFEHSEGRLITIDIENAMVDNVSYPLVPGITGNMPSVFFDGFGNLLGIGAEADIYTNRDMYRLDTETGDVSLFQPMSFERNQDACSCPFKVELLNRVSNRFGFPCTILEFEMTLINRTDRVQTGLVLTDTFPQGTAIRQIGNLPFQAVVTSGEGSNILEISEIDLPIGTFKFKFQLDILDGAIPQTVDNRAYLDEVLLTFLLETERIISDDPLTPEPDDPTHFAILNLTPTFNYIEPVLCSGDTLWLESGVAGDVGYQWNTGEMTNSIAITKAGRYAVTVTSSCDEAVGEIVIREENVSLELGEDFEIELGEKVELVPDFFSNGQYNSFRWTEAPTQSLSCQSCSSTTAQPLENSTYRLILENEWGCSASDQVSINVRPFSVYAPNAFSPNGDQINDRFFLQSHLPYHLNYLRIFDRWGNLVFENTDFFTDDAEKGWDGIARGKAMQPAVFVWLAEFTSLNGEVHQASGEVTLIK